MRLRARLAAGLLACPLLLPCWAAAPVKLDLAGYTDEAGAITILHGGEASDPYFAMQALLLAHDGGMDVSVPASRFADWLAPRQKPDGTFDRFCRGADRLWASCKTADADDSLLAMWMRLLDTMPEQLVAKPQWKKSYGISKASLDHLYQPSRGVYMVSPVYLHGLFMDNLEVWSLKAHAAHASAAGEADKLARAINQTFWDPVNQRYLVSTQLEQRSQKPAFYPDHVAQLFPLLVGFRPAAAETPAAYYRTWMKAYRGEWLRQSDVDYPWGVLAVLAEKQNDRASASCWLRKSGAMRHSARWAVTDEVSLQWLLARGVKPAASGQTCT